MTTRSKVFVSSLAKSAIVLGVVLVFWAIDWLLGLRSVALEALLKFVLPYYVVWLLLTIASIVRRGKSFRILWMGSLRDEETLSMSNAPYAMAFIGMSVVVLLFQIALLR